MNWFGRVTTAVFLALAASSAQGAPAPHARIEQGLLAGKTAPGVEIFLNIPYAAAPIGPLRWRAPQPAAHWSGVRDATAFGPSCIQPVRPDAAGPWTHEFRITGPISEDCLSLNIWRPTPRPGAGPAPVLFWIHGGAYIEGGASAPVYDGTALARRGVVVVSINYRLGVLGFLAHPDLTREAGKTELVSNYGEQDMLAALGWVQTNIGRFGGDPHAVTIAGQSAGAAGVHDLVASPLSRGLFARAIVQSLSPNSQRVPTLAEAEKKGDEFAKAHGLSGLADLRAMSPQALLTATARGPYFSNLVDGVFMPASATELYASGAASDTPMLGGLTADEASGFSPLYGSTDQEAVTKGVTMFLGAAAPRLVSFYPTGTPQQTAQSSKTMMQDASAGYFTTWADLRATKAKSPLYAYVFDHALPGPDSTRYRAFHSAELSYLFGALDASPERGFTPTDRKLADQIQTYWVNFIKTGDPNGAGQAAWPAYDGQAVMILDVPPHSGSMMEPQAKWAAFKAFLAEGGTLPGF